MPLHYEREIFFLVLVVFFFICVHLSGSVVAGGLVETGIEDAEGFPLTEKQVTALPSQDHYATAYPNLSQI